MSEQNRDERAKDGMSESEIRKIGGHVDSRGDVYNPDGGRAWSGGERLSMKHGEARPESQS